MKWNIKSIGSSIALKILFVLLLFGEIAKYKEACVHGKIAKDIKYWQFFEKPKELIHKKKNIHLNYSQINFLNWTIA